MGSQMRVQPANYAGDFDSFLLLSFYSAVNLRLFELLLVPFTMFEIRRNRNPEILIERNWKNNRSK